MAKIRAFKAVIPAEGRYKELAALPYDVYSSKEAREVVKDNNLSFLNIDRAEVNFSLDISPYDDKVYDKARELFYEKLDNGVFIQRESDELYIYELVMDGRSQVGLVACASVDDYENNIIKKHENTRAEKEEDRIRHVDSLDANTGPIFLTYRNNMLISSIINAYRMCHETLFDFTADDGVVHKGWIIKEKEIVDNIVNLFDDIDCLYIADGHHRAASAVKVANMRRKENVGYSGEEEFNYFLSVIFPDNELEILDYNRIVKDLHHNSPEDFLTKLKDGFVISECEDRYKPEKSHTFGMYLDSKWYKLEAKEELYRDEDVVGILDVSILQKNVLSKLLGIADPKTDKRIDFIGGIRGLAEIERRCKEDGYVLGFSMYPTSIDELMDIADSSRLMPPKSTWFEPKLRSGLFIHLLK